MPPKPFRLAALSTILFLGFTKGLFLSAGAGESEAAYAISRADDAIGKAHPFIPRVPRLENPHEILRPVIGERVSENEH